MPDPESNGPDIERLDPDRRSFIKRMAVGAVVAPVVTSFSMSGLSATAAYAGSNMSPGGGNQTIST